MQFIHYDKELRGRARELRNNSTEAEIILWKYLRGRRMLGYKFTRQKPVHHYIIDFYCVKLGLAVEVDGEIHKDQIEDDAIRQKELESLGVMFLRFTNYQVKKDLHIVLKTIEERISSPLLGENRCS
jgi:very-short-patch-repair endonuclease